jgi:hypothetical protein
MAIPTSASCTRSVTIQYGSTTLVMKQNYEVFVNGVPLLPDELPYTNPDSLVYMASSLIMRVSHVTAGKVTEKNVNLFIYMAGSYRPHLNHPPSWPKTAIIHSSLHSVASSVCTKIKYVAICLRSTLY